MTAVDEIPRIERLKVKNFRALRDMEIKRITPLTVLLGPNGSGKSTVFDVFAFLAECFENGLRRAWEKRGKAKELKSRGGEGPVLIEIAYREEPKSPLITYHLEVDEEQGKPIVANEWLRWKRRSYGAPSYIYYLDYTNGTGWAISEKQPDEDDRVKMPLSSPDTLAVNALGLLAEHPRVVALRNFIMSWHVSYFSSDSARGYPNAGPQEHLNRTGDNLANVIQYLSDQHPDHLESILDKLRSFVPKIQDVTAETMPDGRLLLQIKDAPFEQPIMARFASDGTLKMLAYLSLLRDLSPPQFIGIEEPENFLHPRLLHRLGEECRMATEFTQILVTTHSPFFIDALRPDEVRVLWRDEEGYTQCHSLGENEKVKALVDNGALLGRLWMQGHFGIGDPLYGGGSSTLRGKKK